MHRRSPKLRKRSPMFHFKRHSRIHSVGTKNGVPHRIHRVHPVLSHRPCDVSVADVARDDDDAATDGLATTETAAHRHG